MKKFLVLYHAPAESMAQTMNVSPEQMAKGMEAWNRWMQKCGDKLVEMGSPLMNGQQLSVDGGVSGSNKNVSGYSILQAENMDEVMALMNGHPHISGWNKDATIEVHESRPLGG